jgi:hypothetical protein
MAGPSTAQTVVPSTAQTGDTSAERAPIDWQPSREALRVQTQWHAARFELRGRELRVTFDDAEAGYWHDRVDRAASVLHRDAPADVDRFVLAYRQRGAVMAEHVVDRDAWVRERFELLPPREQRPSVMARPPAVAASAPQSLAQSSSQVSSHPSAQASASASAPADVAPPRFEHGLSLALRTSFGGPDAFLLYQLSAVEQFRWRLRADTWVQGTVALGLIDHLLVKPAVLVGVALGGLLFGVGMTGVGYCPGTGIAAAAQGSRSAWFAFLGGLFGAAVFAEAFPAIDRTLYKVVDLGKVTLPDVTGVPAWVFVAGLVVAAAVALPWIHRLDQRPAT